ncbi:MAG: hypothetical protein DYH08_08995 [Actinobacteria bacterium ATB1]|nr:hypothetical protein [Actinobacteria bacterium ATB1]
MRRDRGRGQPVTARVLQAAVDESEKGGELVGRDTGAAVEKRKELLGEADGVGAVAGTATAGAIVE